MQIKKELYFFVFLGLILLALFLRVYHLGTFSLFSDERSSVLLGVANTNQGGMGELMRPTKPSPLRISGLLVALNLGSMQMPAGMLVEIAWFTT